MLSNPKYRAELEAIDAKMKALDAKVKRDLEFDDEGLQMWKLHMDNDDYKARAAEDKEIWGPGGDVDKFVTAHKKVQAELKDLKHDLVSELEDIGHRLEKTGRLLSEPKYRAELEAIGKKNKALNEKVKRNLKWDDEGLDMWTLSMDN